MTTNTTTTKPKKNYVTLSKFITFKTIKFIFREKFMLEKKATKNNVKRNETV